MSILEEYFRDVLNKEEVNTDFIIAENLASGISLDFVDLQCNYKTSVLAGANAELGSEDVPAEKTSGLCWS